MIEKTLYEQFATVAEQLSFTRAAAQLNVAQPWLSARIRKLEGQLGFALFDRTTRRVALTEQGHSLLPKAQAINAAIRAFHETARALGAEAPPLRLGAPLYAGRIRVVREFLDTLRASRPPVAFELDIGWSRQLQARLVAGEADAILMLAPRKECGPDGVELMETHLEVEMDADDPLAAGPLPPAAFVGRDIQVFSRDPNPDLFDAFFRPLQAAGARLRPTELMWSLKHDRQVTALVGGACGLWGGNPKGRRIRRTVDGVPAASLYLIGGAQADNPATAMLWAIARTIGDRSAAPDI